MSLQQMAESLDLPIKKGYFPFGFNRTENYNKVLPQLPDIDEY